MKQEASLGNVEMIARYIWLATIAGMLLVANAAMAQEGDAESLSEEERLKRVLDHSAEETVLLEITLPLAIQFDSEGSDPFLKTSGKLKPSSWRRHTMRSVRSISPSVRRNWLTAASGL